MPASLANSVPIRCDSAPLPADAYVSRPGFALAYATTSAMLLKGESARTITATGTEPIMPTGTKSVEGFNASFGNIVSKVAKPGDDITSVYPSAGDFAA